MRILFVCHRLPYPPNRGGKIRPFNFIRHLNKKREVVVASLAHTPEEFSEGAPLKEYCCEVIAEVVPEAVRWRRAFLALASAKPSSVAYFWSPRLARRIHQAAAQKPFDAVFVHCAFMGPYVEELSAGLRVLDFGDLDSGKWFDYARHRSFPLSWGYGMEARKLRRYERHLAQIFDRYVVTTRGELEEYKSLEGPKPATVIPNGVETSYFHRRAADPNSKLLVFLGRMDYYPNAEGVLYFTRDIFPLVRRAMPDAELRIVGSNPSAQIRNLARTPGITVTGHVPDVRSHVEAAAVSIVPLRIARGTQNKILECMAMGIPVVSTAQAAKGIQATAGQHLLVADTPQEFADQVLALLRDPTLRKQLADAAHEKVLAAQAWPNSLRILDRVLNPSENPQAQEHSSPQVGAEVSL